MAPLAIYVRVSEVGERNGPSFGSPAEQEAAAREWTERAGVEVYFNEERCVDLDVSGALSADKRKLGRLIERCESGELGGIIVRDERRFARDEIEGGVALDRLVECGARLKATWSGFDSENITPESRMVFDFMMAIGKAERARNRLARVAGSRRAADRGAYLAASAPLGYVMDTERRISPGPAAETVRDVFRRRAEGESLRSLSAWLKAQGHQVSKSGVRVLLANRAYVGEMTVPTARKGELEVRRDAHPPLVTEEEWERANAAGGAYHPRNGKWSSQARLTGIVTCSGCGKPLSVHGGGKRKETAYYSCTTDGCKQRVGIRMDRVDGWAEGVLSDAVYAAVPEVLAVLAGDDRHRQALDAVNEARVELETFVESVSVAEIGRDAWIRGKQARAERLAVARKALAALPAPKPVSRGKARKLLTFDEAQPLLDRERFARYFEKIIISPVGRGRRVPVAERAEVWLVGATEPLDLASLTPAGDPQTVAALQAAHT
jgi:DNA invertase Pin-like site-specific DNA recombinase